MSQVNLRIESAWVVGKRRECMWTERVWMGLKRFEGCPNVTKWESLSLTPHFALFCICTSLSLSLPHSLSVSLSLFPVVLFVSYHSLLHFSVSLLFNLTVSLALTLIFICLIFSFFLYISVHYFLRFSLSIFTLQCVSCLCFCLCLCLFLSPSLFLISVSFVSISLFPYLGWWSQLNSHIQTLQRPYF